MIINSQDFDHISFYDDFIKNKQPVLIKNFLNTDELNQLISSQKKNIKPIYGRGAVPFLYLYFNNPEIRDYIFNLPLIKNLACSSKTQFRNEMRFWEHKKGNISYFHYDQRSTDLLNLCLSGSKEWLFISPKTPLKCWPFYNIALPFQQNKKLKAKSLIMEQGDLLYIPRNWFHQVKTLKDNTQNINIIFNDLADDKMEQREKEIASIKQRLLPNTIYGDNIAILNNAIKQVTLTTALKRTIIEIVPIVLLITIVIALF